MLFRSHIDYEVDEKAKTVTVKIIKLNECRAIKPRYYVGVDAVDKYLRRFLPSRNFGTHVVSTNKGMLGHKETVKNYRDWGIPLGRRFRALKLWFVIRSYGVEGIQSIIRYHIELAADLEKKIKEHPQFELLAPRSLNLLCFRFVPNKVLNTEDINRLNQNILESLNSGGKLYLTHTKLNGKYVLRMQIGQTNVHKRHVDSAWELIQQTAIKINEKKSS